MNKDSAWLHGHLAPQPVPKGDMSTPDPLKQRQSCHLQKSRSLAPLSTSMLLPSVFPHSFSPDSLSAVPPPSRFPAVRSAEAAREPTFSQFCCFLSCLEKEGDTFQGINAFISPAVASDGLMTAKL